MRKLSVLISMIVIASSLMLVQANAADSKAGTACTKLGSYSTALSVKYVCAKSGKKQLWTRWYPASDKKSGTVCTKLGTYSKVLSVKYVCTKSGKKKVWTRWYPASPNQSGTESNSSQIFGSSCSTAGEIKIVGDKRYFCESTNRNSNFKWDQGTPTSFKVPIPITLPVAQNGSITFENAPSRVSEISAVSWQRIKEIIDASPEVNVPYQILVGPNTTTVTRTLEEQLLARQFKLWNGFQQTKYLTVIAHNFADMDWAVTTYNKVLKERSYPSGGDPNAGASRVNQNCDVSSQECAAGNAGQVGGTNEAIEFLGVNTGIWEPGSMVGHEYTHTLTAAQFNGTAAVETGYYQQSFTPCWLNEGFSNASGLGAAYTDLQQYSRTRDYNVARYSALPSNFQGFTAAGLKDYLYSQVSNPTSPNSCYSGIGPIYKLGYSIGYAATEALFAIGGPQSVLALFSRGAMGDSFSEAFKNVYGISWDEGSTALGKILAAEYAVRPMRTSN